MSPEQRKAADERLRKERNDLMLKQFGMSSEYKRQEVPKPLLPTKVFSAEGWFKVTEAAGRVGQVFGSMERDALNRDYELLAARLPVLEQELLQLTKCLAGGSL